MIRLPVFKTLIAAALIGAVAGPSPAADKWPERPVTLIVPYPAGGLTDIVSRTIGNELSNVLGTNVIIENRAGAGGQIGLQAMLAAPRDGYTVSLVVPATMVTLPLTNPAYKIKPLVDFQPITVAVSTYLTLVTDPKLGFKSLEDFTAYAKKHPGKMSYGIPGTGTSYHFSNVALAQKLGIDAVSIPYTGEMAVINDLIGSQLQYALVSSVGKNFINDGKLTALAVTSKQRVKELPGVPTVQESGFDFSTNGWVGYAVAAGTPAPIVSKLHDGFVKALRNPEVNQRLIDLGYHVVGNTPDEFRKLVQDDEHSYGALLKSGAIRLD